MAVDAAVGVARTLRLPRAPFADWPIQWKKPGLGYAWYVEPATLITQAAITHASVEAVKAYMDVGDQLIASATERVLGAGGLFIINDWRQIQTYDSAARPLLMKRMKERPKGYLRRTVVCVSPTPVLRMAVQAANLVAAFMAGGPIELTEDLVETLRTYDIGRPPPGTLLPGI